MRPFTFYCASYYGSKPHWEGLRRARANLLLNFWDLRRADFDYIEQFRQSGRKIALDSGAFSSWSQGVTIDRERYLAYVEEHGSKFDLCFGLDHIAGRRGLGYFSEEELEQAAADSRANHLLAKSRGLHLIPVLHGKDEPKWLDLMIADGEPLIGISPYKDEPTWEKSWWAGQVFKNIGDNPMLVHGLGVNAHELLVKFPWSSCDGTGWAQGATTGSVVCPPPDENGSFDFSVPPLNITVSDRRATSFREWRFDAQHLHRWLRSCETELRGVETDVTERLTVCAFYSVRLQAWINEQRQKKNVNKDILR
jgi:hypothetical protein